MNKKKPKKESILEALETDRLEDVGPKFDLHALEKELHLIYSTCSPPFMSVDFPLPVRQEAFRRYQRYLQAITDSQLRYLKMRHILWTALGMYCYFRMADKQRWSLQERLRERWRRSDMRSARIYLQVVERLLKCIAHPQQAVVSCILDYLTEFNLWKRQTLAVRMLLRPLAAGASGATLLDLLLDRVHQGHQGHQGAGSHESRSVVRVMYDLYDFHDWPPLNERSAQALTRLLKSYRKALWDESMSERKGSVRGVALRKGLEVTIRRILEHLLNSDIVLIITYMIEWFFDHRNTEDTILNFGSVLEHAALVHTTQLYKITFRDTLFENLMRLLGSRRRVVCQLGNRILQHLLDRNDNRREFSTPRIFFQNTQFNVTVATFLPEDREFLQKHRKRFHSIIINALTQHCDKRGMMENIYATVCLLAIEIPCAYSAAVMTNLAINVQGLAHNLEDIDDTIRYHMHAFTMGLMSLICWLHNAPDFYIYLNKVINRRAELAPHLNPPLRMNYTFARHHVLRNDPSLFFDVWEVRYSLWMRFKIKHAQTFLEALHATSPPTAAELRKALASGLEPSLVAHVQYPTRRHLLRSFLPVRNEALGVSVQLLSTDSFESDADPRLLDLSIREPDWSPHEKRELALVLPKLLEDADQENQKEQDIHKGNKDVEIHREMKSSQGEEEQKHFSKELKWPHTL